MVNVEPRIETAGLWLVFHKHLVMELFTWLRDRLGDEYWLDIETEILLIPHPSGPVRPVSPDVFASHVAAPTTAVPDSLAATPALLEADEPIGEFEQSWIEVRRRNWNDPDDKLGARVVAALELVSPSNKGLFGERDLRKFLAKRRDYLMSTVSYTEIDLVEGGARDFPAVVGKAQDHPYGAWSSQVQERSRHYWAWGWRQEQAIPTITFPLDYPRTHSLDLATCYHRAFDLNRWSERLEMVTNRD